MIAKNLKNVAVIVAHPDDETLWAGGTILNHPSWKVYILSLSRVNDLSRAPRFYNAMAIFRADGLMGDLDDGPDQKPQAEKTVQGTILQLLPQKYFDLIITHNPTGEYTRHLRHEEVSKAVIKLWHTGKISTHELWTFAYEDGGKSYLPKPLESAAIHKVLSNRIWIRKYRLITETYGYESGSFEAETTPKAESFWQFTNSYDALKWLKNS
jgi:LmbE family N-acetylglucosaminyl deacetylase